MKGYKIIEFNKDGRIDPNAFPIGARIVVYPTIVESLFEHGTSVIKDEDGPGRFVEVEADGNIENFTFKWPCSNSNEFDYLPKYAPIRICYVDRIRIIKEIPFFKALEIIKNECFEKNILGRALYSFLEWVDCPCFEASFREKELYKATEPYAYWWSNEYE